MGKINRNAPCECGSGKKYKKCCGSKVVERPSAIHYEEANHIQKDLMDFALKNYHTEMYQLAIDHPLAASFDKDTQEIYVFNLSIWGLFTQPLANGGTIYDEYLKQKGSDIVRTKTREIIGTWKNTLPSWFLIKEINEETILLENLVTKESANLSNAHYVNQELEVNNIILGFPVDMGTGMDFFVQFISFSSTKAEKIINGLQKELSVWTESKLDVLDMIRKEFPILLSKILHITEENNSQSEVAVDVTPAPQQEVVELAWGNEKEKETAQLVKNGMEKEEYPEELIVSVLNLWRTYCSANAPVIRKPEAFAAALEYSIKRLSSGEFSSSQSKLAEKYGVGASTLSKRFKEMEVFLTEEA